MNPVEKILDPECNDNIILYTENDQAVEFEQIAVLPVDGIIGVILRPLGDNTGLAEDEALVFTIEQDDNGFYLQICEDDALVDAVFDAYYRLLEVKREEL